ncbi:MAG: DUF4013 domain-containing protein [Chloroflexota bacterium]
MNVNKAITFVFEDNEWVSKVLLGTIISLIPLFGSIAVTGYAIAVLRNVRHGAPRPLPTWERLGELFVDGLLFWVALLVYAIPLIILLCPVGTVWIPPAIARDSQDLTAILTVVAAVISAGVGCLALLYALLLWVLSPVLQIRYAEAEKFAACLRFGEVFRFLSDNIGKVLIAQALVWAVGFLITSLASALIGAFTLVPLCGWVVAGLLGLGFLPLGIWLMLFAAYLYGDIARTATPDTRTA